MIHFPEDTLFERLQLIALTDSVIFMSLNKTKYYTKYLSSATRLPILSVVCEEAAVQSEGQAVFRKVTPHACAALGHHP